MIKFKKLIITVALTLCMAILLSSVAFAEDKAAVKAIRMEPSLETEIPAGFTDVLNGASRSTSVPTEYWNLDSGAYQARLDEVRVSWLYTNYFFESNWDGKIDVTYTIHTLDGISTRMSVGLYDMSQKKVVATWTSKAATSTGTTESFSFVNCDPFKYYAIAFQEIYDSKAYGIYGTATISH